MAAIGVGAATARPQPEAPSSHLAKGNPSSAPLLLTGRDVRYAARRQELTSPTAGLAPGFLQANLIVLPSRYAADFRQLCARNPVPCPLVAESTAPGVYDAVRSHIPMLSGSRLLGDCDMRSDAPRYMVYRDAELVKTGCTDVQDEWCADHVAFLLGCSYSFEGALAAAGLPARHTILSRNVPMYRTSIPLCPAGIFVGSTYVVSMRPYKASELDRVRDITRGYNDTRMRPSTLARSFSALRSANLLSARWRTDCLGLGCPRRPRHPGHRQTRLGRRPPFLWRAALWRTSRISGRNPRVLGLRRHAAGGSDEGKHSGDCHGPCSWPYAITGLSGSRHPGIVKCNGYRIILPSYC